MKTKTPKFSIGDKVAYSVQFLKSIGESHGDMAQGRGAVKSIKSYGNTASPLVLIEIDWNIGDLPAKVAAPNLAIVGPNRRFCNVD